MVEPKSVADLAKGWENDISKLDKRNDQDVAYAMVGRLASVWDARPWYEESPLIAEIFDLVADLELPPDIRVAEKDRPKAWRKVKKLLTELEKSMS